MLDSRKRPPEVSQCSLRSGLPPPRTPTVPVLAARAPADPAPAGASPEPRFIMSLFLQKITSGGHLRRANAVFRVASTKTFHLQPQSKAYRDNPGCSVTQASGVYLLQRTTSATSPTSSRIRPPTRTVAVFPDELCGLHAMNS